MQKRSKKTPNILFCIADDASLEHFGTYGASWVNTPNIDDIASKGVKFMNARGIIQYFQGPGMYDKPGFGLYVFRTESLNARPVNYGID